MKKKDSILLAEISFLLNGKQLTCAVPPGLTALELLQDRLGLHGTKSSCNEGDCGACTVIIGQKQGGKIGYQTVNSCLYPAFKLQGRHLITVEGVSQDGNLHPVQTALLDEHGTQCGFCTPGFVMSLLGLFLNNKKPSEAEILAALEGNLCRCTGYDSIMQAAALLRKRLDAKADLLPPQLRKAEKLLSGLPPMTFREADNREGWKTLQCLQPGSLKELWQMLKALPKDQNYKYLAGGTDLMVLANIQHIRHHTLIDLSCLTELDGILLQGNQLLIGANVTLTQLQKHKLTAQYLPLLNQAIGQMASAQIRNFATLAGNIANASPVADGATTLLALDASVVLASPRRERNVLLAEFYHGYKQNELKQDEIIKSITVPLPAAGKHFCSFVKSAKRKAVDISGVVSAVDIIHQNDKIMSATISFGGVAPYPALAETTSAFLKGKKLDEDIIAQAAELAQKEFTPISDIRGSQEYRSILIRNHVLRHLQDLRAELDTPTGRKA